MKKIIAIVIIVLCVWLLAAFPHVMINPGALVKGHQDIRNKCLSCHKPFWGIESQKCIACHKLADIGKDDSNSRKNIILFHQKLADQNCTSCHTDHKGINPGNSLNKFNHALLPAAEKAKCNNCHDKPSDNIHKQITSDCNSCHNINGWKSEVAFNHDKIQGADKSSCISCHKPPADSYHHTFKDNCATCHTTTKWKPSTFDHSAYFILDNHHNASCNTCHSGNNYKVYTCYGCHEHSEQIILESHSEHRTSNISNCISCHKSGSEHEGGEHESGEHGGGAHEGEAHGGDDE